MPTATPTRKREFRKAASTAALALLVVVGAATAFGVHLVVSGTDELAHTYRVIEHIEGAQASVAAVQAAGRGYRLTSHPALREELERLAPQAARAAQALVEVTADSPDQQSRALRLREMADAEATTTLRLARVQDSEGASAAILAMDPALIVAR